MSFLTETFVGLSQQRFVFASVLALASAGAIVYIVRRWYRKTPNAVFKPVGRLTDVWIHPVKSCRGLRVSTAECTPAGLWSGGCYDRHVVILDEDDRLVTMRTEPSLALVQPRVSEDDQCLILDAPGMDTLKISFADADEYSAKSVVGFRVWRLDTEGLLCSDEAGAWFSSYLKKPNVKLMCFKSGTTRGRRPNRDAQWGGKFAPKDEVPGYSDFAPLMLLTEASLQDLNLHLDDPVTVRNVRPNFVVSGTSAFDEDHWKYVKIGDNVTMRRTHGCGRCKLTTVDPETGVYRNDGEPLATLKQYRKVDMSHPDSKSLSGAPVFGANLMCETFGSIKVGDVVYAAL